MPTFIVDRHLIHYSIGRDYTLKLSNLSLTNPNYTTLIYLSHTNLTQFFFSSLLSLLTRTWWRLSTLSYQHTHIRQLTTPHIAAQPFHTVDHRTHMLPSPLFSFSLLLIFSRLHLFNLFYMHVLGHIHLLGLLAFGPSSHHMSLCSFFFPKHFKSLVSTISTLT